MTQIGHVQRGLLARIKQAEDENRAEQNTLKRLLQPGPVPGTIEETERRFDSLYALISKGLVATKTIEQPVGLPRDNFYLTPAGRDVA